MHRTDSPLVAIAVCLAALAGFVDALAFTSVGFFASFMSGNSTRLGVGLGSGSAGDATVAAALVLSFVSGVILAAVIARAAPARTAPAVMAAVTGLLALGAAAARLAPGTLALLLLAAAMGAAHRLLDRGGGAGAGGSTASLVAVGERLAGALMGDADKWGWLAALLPWLGFAAGVVIGAGAHARMGADAFWLAALFAGALTVGLAPKPVRAAPGGSA
ncbi:MAG: DUF1275 family protein [Sphingomonas sp.]